MTNRRLSVIIPAFNEAGRIVAQRPPRVRRLGVQNRIVTKLRPRGVLRVERLHRPRSRLHRLRIRRSRCRLGQLTQALVHALARGADELAQLALREALSLEIERIGALIAVIAAAYYLGANRNKRSITVDIARPAGQALIRRMALQCDVFVENYKVGDMARYGLDAAALRERHPRLVYCSITGYGQTGPYRERAGYDYAIQGLGGLMSVTGERDDRPGGGPQKVGVAVADLETRIASYELAAAMPYVAGPKVIRSDEQGDPVYEDVGLMPRFISLTRKHQKALRDA